MKEEIVKISKSTGNKNLLEAEFNTLANNEFHKISNDIIQEVGLPMSERVFPEWQSWLNREVKRKSF